MAFKILGEKSCEVKGGSQEMAAMMLMLINFNNATQPLINFFSINILAAISWLPSLISQLFHPDFLRLHHFFTAWLFLCGLDYLIKNSQAIKKGAALKRPW